MLAKYSDFIDKINVEGSRTYDTSLLKASDDVEIPDNFKEFVERNS